MIIKRVFSAFKRRLIPEVWMEPWEISIMKTLLIDLKPKRCFEWGAGGSTLLFTRMLQAGSVWISVDHNRQWAKKIGLRLKIGNIFGVYKGVNVIYITPNNHTWSDVNGDGAYSDLEHYVDKPSQLGRFDFMLVDGRARNACLAKAAKIIEDSGVVILHDANRAYYHESFKLFKYGVLLTDHRDNAGGLWIGSHNIDVYKKIHEIIKSLPSNVEIISTSLESH